MSLNEFHIPDLWQIAVSTFIALGLVYLVEWLKQPDVRIILDNELILSDSRKLLKVKVVVSKSGWYRRIFPWTNMATNARLKGHLVSKRTGKEVLLQSYTVKWDSAPEPWDYKEKVPKIELLPATANPENLLPGDEASASVAVKHEGDDCFFIYDGNYYISPSVNERSEKEVILRLVFSSSSISKQKEFVIVNGNKSINSFNLKTISGNTE